MRWRKVVQLGTREKAALARQVFAMHERGVEVAVIARALGLTRTAVANLIGYGRRLAAGQAERLDLPGS